LVLITSGRLAVGFAKFGSYEELNKHALKHLLDVIITIKKVIFSINYASYFRFTSELIKMIHYKRKL
jgi:hypothetical protein